MSHATTSSTAPSEAAARLEAERETHGPDVIVLDHTGYVGHGNTVAAWACVAIMSVGIVIGLIGFVLLISIYLVIVGRGFFISWQAQETFSRLLAADLPH